MSDICFICNGLLSDVDLVEVRRDLQIHIKNANIHRGDGNIELLNTVT